QAVDDRTRQRYPAWVLEFMAAMRPRLNLAGCDFSHVVRSVDPYDAQALWSFDEGGPPDFTGRVWRSFAAVPERLMFVGHHHRWLAVTTGGPLEWGGEGSPNLACAQRYFVGVGAVFQAHRGLLDTERAKLRPLPC